MLRKHWNGGVFLTFVFFNIVITFYFFSLCKAAGNQFWVQRKAHNGSKCVVLWAENSHSLKLRCGYGAERTRQRSFKPRSEFYFLFRDTAGFQTDLPGSGTQN